MRIVIGVIAGIIILAVCIWSWRLSNVDNTVQNDIENMDHEQGGNIK